MARKPRIITETVQVMRAIAGHLDSMFPSGLGETSIVQEAAVQLKAQADNLDGYDARESRKDPSKRRKAKKRAKR